MSLARRDVLGIAQTGTGKTAAFVLPMLTLLEKGRARARMPRTLILEPTRELAAQVEESFNRYGRNHKLTVALLIGGVSFDDQDKKLDRGVDVLIATPGPPARPFRARQAPAHRRRDPRHRRGRPHARHGLHSRTSSASASCCRSRARRCSSRPPCRRRSSAWPTRSCTIRCASRRRGRPTAAATVTQFLVAAGREPADKREVLRELIRERRRLQERDHLLQPQARRGDPAEVAGRARLQRRRAAWRHGPARAHGDARRLQATTG